MRSLVMTAVLAYVAGQSGAQRFAGTWTADLAGQTYVRLELTMTNGEFGGRISLGAVHFGSNGTVEAVTHSAQTFTPIFDVALRNDVLSFARKDEDDIDRFEMRLVNGEGRLTIFLSSVDLAELASQGISTLQPLTLKRATR